MKVVVLRGESNSGKTSTLNIVFDQLTYEDYTIESFRQIGENEFDFFTILRCKALKIGVVTMGDFSSNDNISAKEKGLGSNHCINFLQELKDAGCQKTICAISITDNLDADLVQIANTYPYHYILQKAAVPKKLHNPNNTEYAESLIKLLDS